MRLAARAAGCAMALAIGHKSRLREGPDVGSAGAGGDSFGKKKIKARGCAARAGKSGDPGASCIKRRGAKCGVSLSDEEVLCFEASLPAGGKGCGRGTPPGGARGGCFLLLGLVSLVGMSGVLTTQIKEVLFALWWLSLGGRSFVSKSPK